MALLLSWVKKSGAGFPAGKNRKRIGAKIREGLKGLTGHMNTHLAQLKDYPTTAVTGAHAMVVVGYDDFDASYIVANSWGTHWGDGGYFKVDRGQIHADMMDAWVVMDVKATEYVKPEPIVVPAPAVPPVVVPEPSSPDQSKRFDYAVIAIALAIGVCGILLTR